MATYLPYVVRQGDYLDKLAAHFGFDAAEVWNHPKNKSLKELRKDPNILCPCDLLHFPRTEPEPLSFNVGEENVYMAAVPEAKISVILLGPLGPMKNQPLTLMGDAIDHVPVVSDASGKVEFDVPVTTEEVILQSDEPRFRVHLAIGHLDPISEPRGIAERLRNLHFFSVTEFQRENQLPLTGQADDATREALLKLHGC